ncbi:MAG: hypothetical protein PWP31_1697 [Clostridia bacterium]|nr:hypothetical protein [Clostridia bacterium]MDK2901729.1 hypothetical protein [Thermosediminibacterales bacterium]
MLETLVGVRWQKVLQSIFAKYYGKDVLEAFSAGTKPAEEINPNAVTVMKEAGIDLSEPVS